MNGLHELLDTKTIFCCQPSWPIHVLCASKTFCLSHCRNSFQTRQNLNRRAESSAPSMPTRARLPCLVNFLTHTLQFLQPKTSSYLWNNYIKCNIQEKHVLVTYTWKELKTPVVLNSFVRSCLDVTNEKLVCFSLIIFLKSNYHEIFIFFTDSN